MYAFISVWLPLCVNSVKCKEHLLLIRTIHDRGDMGRDMSRGPKIRVNGADNYISDYVAST